MFVVPCEPAGVVAVSAVGDRVRRDRALWIQCACTALVALGAAYASYRHGREFALRFGADESTASIWPLIVDGLLTAATVELWKNGHDARATGRWAAWLAFGFGISLSLCANIGSASRLSVFGVMVAACPPLALLLAVELLNRALKRHRAETVPVATESVSETTNESDDRCESPVETGAEVSLAVVSDGARLTAEERMWAYFVVERAKGRTPSGAELDRMAGTHNYGRRMVRRWRDNGRLSELVAQRPLRAVRASL
ncbi:DUF2637 domain-containing protein [Amycolatopsis samaneae]|uniref:DUF2637 domain-containing protein n=1 Tax=Amycolatopsis samaneae TaxID=664691 RepID=A0ABW5GRM8_9PSEU